MQYVLKPGGGWSWYALLRNLKRATSSTCNESDTHGFLNKENKYYIIQIQFWTLRD